jgi:hypothetical protein
MDIPISEITYGFSFVENLVRANVGKRIIPFFPTLREEALRGYDVRTRVAGKTRFYQFKIPKVMIRDNAIECLAPSNLVTPFLRMPLMRRLRSEQHNILVQLRARRQNVFYACPRLYEDEPFRRSYQLGRIHLDSAYINPADIGQITDDLQHEVAFEPNSFYAWYRSDPRRIHILPAETGLPSFDGGLDEAISLQDRAAADVVLIEDLLRQFDLRPEEFRDTQSFYDRLQTVGKLVFLCRHVLGVQPMYEIIKNSVR